MPYCPKCKSLMGTMETACNKCGFDFPLTKLSTNNRIHEITWFAPAVMFLPIFGTTVGMITNIDVIILVSVCGTLVALAFGLYYIVSYFNSSCFFYGKWLAFYFGFLVNMGLLYLPYIAIVR